MDSPAIRGNDFMDREHIIRAMIAWAYFIFLIFLLYMRSIIFHRWKNFDVFGIVFRDGRYLGSYPYFFIVHEANNLPQVEEFRYLFFTDLYKYVYVYWSLCKF